MRTALAAPMIQVLGRTACFPAICFQGEGIALTAARIAERNANRRMNTDGEVTRSRCQARSAGSSGDVVARPHANQDSEDLASPRVTQTSTGENASRRISSQGQIASIDFDQFAGRPSCD